MRLGVPAEVADGERRVAATPETVAKYVKWGFEVQVERGAGVQASFPDKAFEEAGATLVSVEQAWDNELVVKVNAPTDAELSRVKQGSSLICLVQPDQNQDLCRQLGERGVTLLALDKVPRITRAQKMDVLSSMANIAGYRAVVEASHHFGGFFGAQITAAGKTAPAQVLVIGAGVAGLAAIGAARGLGAIVKAFDVRPAVKEQVESMGGQFLMLEFEESGDGGGGYAKVMSDEFIAAEMALFLEQAKQVDVVITTALIPGRKAPILWTREHVEAMKPGSVIVDLAAQNGGNCELTQPGEVIVHEGVSILGHTDLTSRLPTVASKFFAKNVQHLVDEICKRQGSYEHWSIDHDDEAIRGCLVLEQGENRWPPPKVVQPSPPPPPPEEALPEPAKKADVAKKKDDGKLANLIIGTLAIATFAAVGIWAPLDFVRHFTVFVLACFVGWQVIWNVNHALHTPLMSVTNAISGIIIVGGMIQAGTGDWGVAAILGGVAILFAAINVAGGFLVTHRMLAMFRRGD